MPKVREAGGKAGMNGEHRELRVGMIILVYDTIIEDTCHYTFVKTYRIYTTSRVEW